MASDGREVGWSMRPREVMGSEPMMRARRAGFTVLAGCCLSGLDSIYFRLTRGRGSVRTVGLI